MGLSEDRLKSVHVTYGQERFDAPSLGAHDPDAEDEGLRWIGWLTVVG
jgi:hypothetical protein